MIGEPSDEANAVFDPSTIQTYEITLNPSDLARIDRRPSDETKVSATLHFNGRTYGPLAFRYKGSVGAFLSPCTSQAAPVGLPSAKVGKCSIKLEFNEYDKNGRFYGLKKLNLHAMGHDESMMRERLGYSLYRAAGIAAPRAMHARVVINGRLEGIFVAVEQIDGKFTQSRFAEGGQGNLYKEVWPIHDSAGTYRTALETNEGSSTDVSKMLSFRRAIQRGATTAMQWLDSGYMMRYLAIDRLILNDDGMLHWYCAGQMGNNPGLVSNHNYYWYEAAGSDRMWLIPWDLDSSMNDDSGDLTHIATRWNQPALCLCMPTAGAPQQPPSCDQLTAILGGLRSEYSAALTAMIRGPFAASVVDANLAAWTQQLSPLVAEAAGVRGAPSVRAWNAALSDLKRILAESRSTRGFE